MEEIKVTDGRMYSLIVLHDLHTGYFNRVVEGISDDDALKRLNTKANHVAWIAGSMVHERFEIAKSFGIQLQASADALFKDHQGIQDNISYPSLAEYRKDWETISPLLREALLHVEPAKLNVSLDMGGAIMTLYDLAVFMTYREANCIGQIALWRRLLGYEPMKYM